MGCRVQTGQANTLLIAMQSQCTRIKLTMHNGYVGRHLYLPDYLKTDDLVVRGLTSPG